MGDLTIHTIVNGKWKQNCYLVVNSDLDALLIDPGSESDTIARSISELKLNLMGILNTHAHYDHIGAVARLQEEFRVPFYLN
jgi:glyoxylase-like metal-dependent hydrolase (beta-lactamase superfamily II)